MSQTSPSSPTLAEAAKALLARVDAGVSGEDAAIDALRSALAAHEEAKVAEAKLAALKPTPEGIERAVRRLQSLLSGPIFGMADLSYCEHIAEKVLEAHGPWVAAPEPATPVATGERPPSDGVYGPPQPTIKPAPSPAKCGTCGGTRNCRGPSRDYDPEIEEPPPPCGNPWHTANACRPAPASGDLVRREEVMREADELDDMPSSSTSGEDYVAGWRAACDAFREGVRALPAFAPNAEKAARWLYLAKSFDGDLSSARKYAAAILAAAMGE